MHVIYSEDQEIRCHGCGDKLPTDGRQELSCSSRSCRVYTLQPPIKPGQLNSADTQRWLEERYLVDILLRQGGGDREEVAGQLKIERDRKLKEAKAADAIGGWLKQEHLRDEAAKIERGRVLVLEG